MDNINITANFQICHINITINAVGEAGRSLRGGTERS
jgi:hypothetical protein